MTPSATAYVNYNTQAGTNGLTQYVTYNTTWDISGEPLTVRLTVGARF